MSTSLRSSIARLPVKMAGLVRSSCSHLYSVRSATLSTCMWTYGEYSNEYVWNTHRSLRLMKRSTQKPDQTRIQAEKSSLCRVSEMRSATFDDVTPVQELTHRFHEPLLLRRKARIPRRYPNANPGLKNHERAINTASTVSLKPMW
jgi:hypothetical protein